MSWACRKPLSHATKIVPCKSALTSTQYASTILFSTQIEIPDHFHVMFATFASIYKMISFKTNLVTANICNPQIISVIDC